MIEPHYATFNQAKWLKEIGFNYHKIFQAFASYYDYYDKDVQGRCHESDFSEEVFPDDKWIPVPEHWQVVEWLRVNHGIDIFTPKIKGEYFYDIWKDINEVGFYNERIVFSHKGFKTPQEAYSAAFDWIKDKNLI
jgi:hypothetical protein